MSASPTASTAQWTKRDGSPVRLGMTFTAPYSLIIDGVEVEHFGDDERRATERYMALVQAAHGMARPVDDVCGVCP